MTITLKELDEMWTGGNIDKDSLKYLCRKYSPQVIMEWIERGLTISNKDKVIIWHKTKLKESGIILPETPEEVKDGRLFKEEVGDYFN